MLLCLSTLLGITKIRLQQEETVLKMLPLTSMLSHQARTKWWGKVLMPDDQVEEEEVNKEEDNIGGEDVTDAT